MQERGHLLTTNVGRRLTNVGRRLANFGRRLANFGRQLANVGRRLANFGRQLANVGRRLNKYLQVTEKCWHATVTGIPLDNCTLLILLITCC